MPKYLSTQSFLKKNHRKKLSNNQKRQPHKNPQPKKSQQHPNKPTKPLQTQLNQSYDELII